MALVMLIIAAEEDITMSTTTVRVLVGSVIVAGLLGLGALEVVSERVPSPVVRGAVPTGEPDSPQAYAADLEFREESSPSPTQMSGAVQMRRNTVLSVDPAARRFRSLTGTGHVRVSDVSKGTLVVTEEAQAAGLALLMPGDVIRVEAPYGQIQRIVVLRRGWQELESPEK
jgi:hypothetical protein